MTRALLLFCAPAMFAACDVGDVPATLKPDGPGVVCEQPAINPDGHHNIGGTCINTGCHGIDTQATGAINMAMGGTLYETANGAGKGTATIIISWTGGSAKAISATGPDVGLGNFYMDPTELAGITYPATVKVSLCPDAERPMLTTLKDATDLNCSKAGCHGNGTAKVFWRQ